MYKTTTLVTGLTGILLLTACGSSSEDAETPEELYESCIAVFEEKGGPVELGQAMCDSMRKACEANPDGEECAKAKRIVDSA